MRILRLLDYALGALLRHRLKNLAILVAFTLCVATLGSILLLTSALQGEARQLLSGAPDLIVQRLLGGRHELIPLQRMGNIAKIPGVAEVRPRYWGYYYDGLTKTNLTLQGVEAHPDQLQLLQGRLPSAAGECAVGRGVAEVRLLDLEDDLVMINAAGVGESFLVVGLFEAESDLLTHDLVLLPETDLQLFFGQPADLATDLAVRVPNAAEIDVVARKIRRFQPDLRPVARNEIARTYDAVFSWRSGMLLSLFVSALLAFCILAWDKATGLSAVERREIAVLKAIGWSTGGVLLSKCWEGLVISLSAFLLGTLIAYLHVFFAGAPLLRAVLQGWSVMFPPFSLAPLIDFELLGVLAAATILPYLASSVVPAWQAAVASPDQVLRG